MRKIVQNSDLGIPYTTVLNRMIIKLAQSMLGINKINHLYDKASDKEGVDFAEAVLKELDITVETNHERLGFIPKKGAFVMIANHPHGALDGLLLLLIVAKIRPDVKFMGNFLLTKIDTLSDFFLTVDSFDHSNYGSNIMAVRNVIEHLKGGAPLVVFPAVEVSTDQKWFGKVEDKPWDESIVKLILRAEVPVVPVYIDGRNSLVYRVLSRMSPLLGGVRLLHELTNKREQSIGVVFGSKIPARRLKNIAAIRKVSDLLRLNVYCLKAVLVDGKTSDDEKERELKQAYILKQQKLRKKERQRQEKKKGQTRVSGSEEEVIDSLLVGRELDSLAATRMLTRVGDLCLFCAPTSEIPLTMREIVRLRRATVGEMDHQERALSVNGEEYDDLYEHLFVWDAVKQAIAGAYRIGFGDVLMDYRGFEGFYTYTSFEFSRHLNDALRHSIELGVSFVVSDYQHKPQILLLLWRGILQILLRNPSYRYLIGMLDMPGDYTTAAKWLLIDYIKANHWNKELAKYVVARNSISQLGRPSVDMSLGRDVVKMEDVDKLIRDVETSGQGIPLLMKKYLEIGRVMGFSIDPLFNDKLGVMLVFDLCDVSKNTIEMMAREFGAEEDVYERFRVAGSTML